MEKIKRWIKTIISVLLAMAINIAFSGVRYEDRGDTSKTDF